MPSTDDINHQQKLLATYRRTLAIQLDQRAAVGAAYAPPGIINGISDARSEIRRIKAALRNWGVDVNDAPNDHEPTEAERVAHPNRPRGQKFNFHGPVSAGTIQYGGTQHIGEVQINMGDSFNFQDANLSGSNNNFNSTLTHVSQIVGVLPHASADQKQQLEHLLKALGVELEKVPTDAKDDAEAVEELAKELLEKASKAKPNKSTIAITADGLKQAAQNLAGVLPAVLPIAVKIVEQIHALIK